VRLVVECLISLEGTSRCQDQADRSTLP
jgi:hypothetical protein